MGSSGSHGAGEMCLEGGGGGGGVRVGRRNGGKKAAAAEQKVAKQPQRGLGVAQLEKIRLHNQMIAAYRSGMQPPPQQQPQEQQVPLAAAMAGAASFQPYLTDCFEAMDRRIADVQYSQHCADNLLPYSSSRPPVTPLLVHEVSNSSSSAQRQQPPQYYWMSSSGHESSGRSTAGSTEELDLELRL